MTKYCINITNYGFDGEVTFAQLKYKRRPFHDRTPMPINAAAAHCFFFKMNQPLKVTLDDKVVFDGKGLVAIANGYCYGGGYHCAPQGGDR
jgi:diacylglycerol kinase family enzyme